MVNYFRCARFFTSASKASQFPEAEIEGDVMEVAFAGRSNAGKSSALNTLCDQKSLARISKTPGRTQLINFFTLDEQRSLVDLPGYGYAKVPEKVRNEWQQLMESYLGKRQQLRGLVVIMDIRHPLKDYDVQMLEWCEYMKTPVHILLTKADKLKKGAASKQLLSVRKSVQETDFNVSVQMFSSLKKTGIEELQTVLNSWFELS
ncbi:GTP-binding protein EngB [hydrothermal vent metagenome]|uniref:GTP-binding protein EngB n=1 Tax=hydrothermal vent metagenome TaxID=652676 RepID=A0A3B0YJD9_9ZZZZ